MKTLKEYINESIVNNMLDSETLTELKELNTFSPIELKNFFSVLNYKQDSKEAQEIIKSLPEKFIEFLKNHKYASTPQKYYTGIRALFTRVKIENYVLKKMSKSNDIKNIKQTPHNIDREAGYDFTSSIGNIDVKIHFFDNENFTINKNETAVEWYCFVDCDLSDVTQFTKNFNNSKLYIVNKKKLFDKSNVDAPGKSKILQNMGDHYLVLNKYVKELADYII